MSIMNQSTQSVTALVTPTTVLYYVFPLKGRLPTTPPEVSVRGLYPVYLRLDQQSFQIIRR